MDIVERIERYIAGKDLTPGTRTRLVRARDEIVRLRKSKPAQEPEQPAIPQGWKLVPIEPTPEMMDAAHNVAGCLSYTEYRSVFRAMLNAAPTPQGEKK